MSLDISAGKPQVEVDRFERRRDALYSMTDAELAAWFKKATREQKDKALLLVLMAQRDRGPT